MANPTPITPPPSRGRPKGSKNSLPSPARLREYRRSRPARVARIETAIAAIFLRGVFVTADV